LSRTIAISASRSISSGVARPGRPSEIPIEALMNHSRAPIGNGARSSDPIRSATARASSALPHLVEEDAELIAAEACDGVARSKARDQPLAHGDQEPVTDVVADALVDDLEAIEIEQDDTGLAIIVDTDRRQCAGDPVGQELAVRQAGGRVIEGAPLGGVHEPGVVQGDRGELGEARQRVDLALAPIPFELA